MLNTAVILAGGFGTRLKSVTGQDIPKPLVDFCGQPLLGYQIQYLIEQGFDTVYLTLGYGADKIKQFCADNNNFDISIHFLIEDEPLGTAGAVLENVDMLPSEFAVVYSDTVLGVDFSKFYDYHKAHKDTGATVFLYPTTHPEDSDLFELNDNKYLNTIHPAPHDKEYQNLSNQALYIMTKSHMEKMVFESKKIDFVKDIFMGYLQAGIPIAGYVCGDYIVDLGTENRYKQVVQDYKGGLIKPCKESV